MREIKAIIQPFMLTKVITALRKIEGLPGITISEIKGFGRSAEGGRGKGAKEKVSDEIIEYVPKVKIEIVVKEEMVDEVLTTIQESAHTGNPGDGKIFVSCVDNVVRVRTNERGEGAI